MRAWWLWVLLADMVCFGQQQGKNPFHSSSADIDVGRATFRIYCSPCHGIRAQGGTGPDLTLGAYAAGDSDAELYDVIANGVPGTEMAGFGARMNENSIWRIVAYLRSVSQREPEPVSGDLQNGQQIFWSKGACASCHRVNGDGGRFGPDLSRVGRARSLSYLRESLTDPHARLTPGYNTVSVVTSNGKKITGIEKGLDNFSAQLMDSSEEIRSYLRREVRSIERENGSLMPAYGDVLTQTELNDVLAYLVSLRGEEKQ